MPILMFDDQCEAAWEYRKALGGVDRSALHSPQSYLQQRRLDAVLFTEDANSAAAPFFLLIFWCSRPAQKPIVEPASYQT